MSEFSQQEHERLLQFLYQCPVGLASTDGAGNIHLLNAMGAQLLLPLAGSSIGNIFEVFGKFDEEIARLIAGRPEPGEICRDRRLLIPEEGGRPKSWISLSLVRLGSDSIEACFADVTRVVETELRVLEVLQARAVQEGKIEIITNVLHDIGNAVTGLGTRAARSVAESDWQELKRFAQLEEFLSSNRAPLEQALGAAKAGAFVKFASALHEALRDREARSRESAAFYTNTVRHIQEILNLQRHIVADGHGAKEVPLRIRDLIEDALSIQEGGLRKRNITVVKNIPPALPEISGDRTKLLQVLINLLKNAAEAFDAMPPAEGRNLTVSADAGDNRIVIAIADNACGFDAAEGAGLFERGKTGKAGGSGFGLAHARAIIESHGGTLTLESSGRGTGARATLTIPLSSSPPADPDI